MEVHTNDSFDFVFIPCQTQSLNFSLQALRDASIALATEPQNKAIVFELLLGGASNTAAFIKKQIDSVIKEVTDRVLMTLSDTTFQNYWFKWDNNHVRCGIQGNVTPMLKIPNDKEVPQTKFIGIRTCWGSTGVWRFNPIELNGLDVKWVEESLGEIPRDAIIAGFEEGSLLYIGRAYVNDELMVGKINRHHNFMEITQKEGAWTIQRYEVLCGVPPLWETVNQGSQVPSNAFAAGFTKNGSPLYVGRALNKMDLTVGQVEEPGGMKLPYDGTLFSVYPYQVLVIPKKQEN